MQIFTNANFLKKNWRQQIRVQKQHIDPAGAQRTLIIIWFALLVSQILFLLLIYFIRPGLLAIDPSRPLMDRNAVAVALIAMASLTDLAISFAMRKKYLNQAAAEQNIGLVQNALIVGCAFCESVGLFGLLLAFAFNYPYFWLFSTLGIFGTILHFPRRSNIEAATYKMN
jgi:hypothetical protein